MYLFLPVANAFGFFVGTMAIFGIGMSLFMQIFLTSWCSLGACASETIFAL